MPRLRPLSTINHTHPRPPQGHRGGRGTYHDHGRGGEGVCATLEHIYRGWRKPACLERSSVFFAAPRPLFSPHLSHRQGRDKQQAAATGLQTLRPKARISLVPCRRRAPEGFRRAGVSVWMPEVSSQFPPFSWQTRHALEGIGGRPQADRLLVAGA